MTTSGRYWRMMVGGGLAVAVALSVIGGVRAQDIGTLPEPYPEMQELAFTVGAWDVTGQVRLAADSEEWTTFDGVAAIAWHLEGHALREVLTVVAGDQIVLATGLRAFGSDGRWQMAWADTVSNPVLAFVGQWQGDDQLYFTNRGAGEIWEVVLSDMSADAFTVNIQIASGIGRTPEPFWTARYARRTADAADITPEVIAGITAEAALPERPAKAEQFDFWVGEWTMDSQYPSGDDFDSYPARDTVSAVIGGYAIEEHVHAETPSGPLVAYSLSRYNPAQDAWDNVWFGVGIRRMQAYQGTCDREPGLCKLAGHFYDVEPGVTEFWWAIPDIDNPSWRMLFTRVSE